MTTKTIELYVDLYPGWQDNESVPYLSRKDCLPNLYEGGRRIKVSVELPCFGGSADTTATVMAQTTEI